MINDKKNGVIVLGGHIQGLGIARVFGKNGIPVILIDDTAFNITRYSKYCLEFHLCEKENLLEYLLNLATSNNQFKKWLIIPTNDFQVKLLSQNHAELSKYYFVSTDLWNSVYICYNKIETYKKASELGILIPETFFPKDSKEIENIKINYPCIIKPAIMHEFYDKLKKKVFVCKTKTDLYINYKKAIQVIPPEQIIIQEIIPGTAENQYSACFYIQDGNIVSTLTARRKRQHPLDFGNATTFAEIVDCEKLRNIGEKLIRNIGYNGVCEVEFKMSSSDGQFYFLEINPRTWKWHYIAHISNINFLLNFYNYFNKLPYIADSQAKESICWQHFITDFPTMLRQMIKGQYKKSNCNKKQLAVFDKADILPAVFEILILPILIFKR